MLFCWVLSQKYGAWRHSSSFAKMPSGVLVCPFRNCISIPQCPRCAGEWMCLFWLGCCWGMKKNMRDLDKLIVFGLTEILTPCNIDHLIASSTVLKKSQIYSCALSEWLLTYLCFHFEQVRSEHLTVQSFCFRVVRLSCYIQDFTFYLSTLQN